MISNNSVVQFFYVKVNHTISISSEMQTGEVNCIMILILSFFLINRLKPLLGVTYLALKVHIRYRLVTKCHLV